MSSIKPGPPLRPLPARGAATDAGSHGGPLWGQSVKWASPGGWPAGGSVHWHQCCTYVHHSRLPDMATRGIWQLRRCQLFFSDRDGSSRGMRSARYSFELRIRCSFARNNSACREFIKQSLIPVSAQNPQIEFEALLRRGRHPTIRAQYGTFRFSTVLALLRCNDPKSFRS